MWRARCRREASARLSAGALLRAALFIVGCAGATAGCATDGQPLLGAASLHASTVAFESIDGPPETVFRKLVVQLDREAATRQIAVVSREQPALYRVRAYVDAHVQAKKVIISWVWDVYNADRQRAMRFTGEVPGAAPERNAWLAADDQVINRVARDGMDRLVAYLANPGPAPELPPTPDQSSPNVAFAPSDVSAPDLAGVMAYLPPSRP